MTDQTLAQIMEESRKLENAGKRQEAVDYLKVEIDKACVDHAPYTADLFNQRGFVYRMMQNYDGAANDYSGAISWSTTRDQLAAAHINMADIHRVAKGDAPAAHASLDKALENAGRWSVLEAKAHDQRGMVFDYTEKKFPEAIKEYRRAQRICEDLLEQNPDDKDAQNRFGQAVLHLGYCYFETNDSALLPKAYEALNGALEIFQKHDDRQGIMNTVTSLGRLALHHKDYDGALTQYQKATEILRETQHRGAICSLHLHYAEVYLAKGKEGRDQAFLHLEALRDGIKKGDMSTPSDAKALKERFASLNELYDAYGMKVDGFEEVQKFFNV